MISCPNEFGIYKSSEIMTNMHLQSDVSENTAYDVSCMSRSFDGEQINYLKRERIVMAVSQNSEGEVVKEHLLTIQGLADIVTIKDLWVFKEFLAVSIIKGTLIFYEKPVIAGSSMWPLSIPTTFPFADYLDGYSFVPSLEDANVVEFYGVKPDDKVARYLFTFDYKSKSVKVTDSKTIDYPQFDGKNY